MKPGVRKGTNARIILPFPKVVFLRSKQRIVDYIGI